MFCMRKTTPCTPLSVGAVGWSMNSDSNKRWETHNSVSHVRIQTVTQSELIGVSCCFFPLVTKLRTQPQTDAGGAMLQDFDEVCKRCGEAWISSCACDVPKNSTTVDVTIIPNTGAPPPPSTVHSLRHAQTSCACCTQHQRRHWRNLAALKMATTAVKLTLP